MEISIPQKCIQSTNAFPVITNYLETFSPKNHDLESILNSFNLPRLDAMNLHIIGNCQVKPVSSYLSHALEGSEHKLVVWPQLHLINESECTELSDSLQHADILVCMPVGDNYRSMPLGSSQVAAKCPSHCKVIIYPNCYFKGYYPTFDYVRDQQGAHIISSNPLIRGNNPFSDYHDSVAAKLCLTMSECDENIFEAFLELISSSAAAFKNVAVESLLEIQRRDVVCSFSLYETIQTSYQKTKLFHSFNHPANVLIEALSVCILQEAGLADERLGRVTFPSYTEFLGCPDLPILPSVYDALGLSFPCHSIEAARTLYFVYFSFLRMNRDLFSPIFL